MKVEKWTLKELLRSGYGDRKKYEIDPDRDDSHDPKCFSYLGDESKHKGKDYSTEIPE